MLWNRQETTCGLGSRESLKMLLCWVRGRKGSLGGKEKREKQKVTETEGAVMVNL